MEIVRDFAASTIRDAERNHGVIFEPLDVSLAQLVAAGRPFSRITGRDNHNFMNLVSISTQIAIFPWPEENFYVPESNKLSLDRQRELLAVDEAEVIRGRWHIGGLRLVMGDVATHTGFVFAYFDRSGGIRLHGLGYVHRCARTETSVGGSNVVIVGHFGGLDGLDVTDVPADYSHPDIWVVRLGVPVQE